MYLDICPVHMGLLLPLPLPCPPAVEYVSSGTLYVSSPVGVHTILSPNMHHVRPMLSGIPCWHALDRLIT